MMNIDSAIWLVNNLRFKEFFTKNKEMEMNEDVVSKLKFLGKVQKGEKINVKYMYVQPDGIATKIARSFINFDSRANMLNFVKNTISQSFNIIYSFFTSGTSSQKSMCMNIIEDIKSSKDGIKNLKFTYTSDVMLCCQLDTILQEIDAKLEELGEKYPDVKKQNIEIQNSAPK